MAAQHHEMPNGDYTWRGGRKISLEKVDDRFTIMPRNREQVARIQAISNGDAIKPVTNQVYKIETTVTRRDTLMDHLRSPAYQGIVHHAYKPSGTDGTIYYITDRIIVRFKRQAETGAIEALLARYALRVLRPYSFRANTYLLQVTDGSGANPVKIANRLAEEDLVSSAEVNMVNRLQPMFIPPDPLFVHQWHLHAQDGPQVLAAASVNAPAAWDITHGVRDVVVAVLDDGFDLTHPDFSGPGKVVHPKDYVDGDAHPFPELAYEDYHGTPTAGVALAESNGIGVVGVAHGCAFMPVRFPLAADDAFLIDLFSEVGSKADVISCSWGPPPVNAPLHTDLSYLLGQLAANGGPRGNGCVICFAAGNYNAPLADKNETGQVTWTDYGAGIHRVTFGEIFNGFAAHPDVIAVAASTSLNRHAAYSNWGPEISVCAPSNNFHPLFFGAFVPGQGIWTTDNEAFGVDFQPGSRYTGSFGGTSSATPLVAGVAALVRSANPDLTAAKVRALLERTADKIVDSEPDVVTGVNRGVYDAEGRCDWFGYGKVNAAAAVAEAKRLAELDA
jgi:subtilisin family serine protease